MLVIRMQRTGRKGHAMFRVVVQDSRRTPTSGKIVASLGSYDPHNKVATINTEKAQFYLDHGAQPSDRAALLLKTEGVKLPKWVATATKKTGKLKNPDKLRRNRPAEPVEPVEPADTAAPAEAGAAAEPAADTPAGEEAASEGEQAAAPTEAADSPAETPAAEATTADETAAETTEQTRS